MAYGDYDGPNKPDKGQEGGSCNRRLCQASPADWYNHRSRHWYCIDCARTIGNDPVNKADWALNFFPKCAHPMFETREMIDFREALIADFKQKWNEGLKNIEKPLTVNSLKEYAKLFMGEYFEAPDFSVGFKVTRGPTPNELIIEGPPELIKKMRGWVDK